MSAPQEQVEAQSAQAGLREENAALRAELERLVEILARDAEELGRGQRAEAERALTQARLDELEAMVSFRLILRAKRVWDRMPRLKRAVKAVAKRIL